MGCGALRGAGREAAARPGRPRGLCSPAGDRAAPEASWPLTSRATWPAPRKTKERRCPWAGLAFAFVRVGEERRGPRAGPGPRRYRLCQLWPGGPPGLDLGDRSAGVCGSAIAQLTPSVSLFLSMLRFLETLGAACNRCTLRLVLNSTEGQNSNRQTCQHSRAKEESAFLAVLNALLYFTCLFWTEYHLV